MSFHASHPGKHLGKGHHKTGHSNKTGHGSRHDSSGSKHGTQSKS